MIGNGMDRLRATEAALADLVRDTGRSLRQGAASVALYAEAQRMQLVALATAGEPGLDRATDRALANVRLFAGVAAAEQGDAFDARFAAVIGVALQIAAGAA